MYRASSLAQPSRTAWFLGSAAASACLAKTKGETRVKPMVQGVLGLDGPDKDPLQARPPDLLRDDEVLAEHDVPLRFLGEGHQPEPLDLLDGQPADPDDIEIEDGVLGHGVVPHLEDDGLVGPPGPFDFGPGRRPQLVDRARIA